VPKSPFVEPAVNGLETALAERDDVGRGGEDISALISRIWERRF
jgi:hypothetical protein